MRLSCALAFECKACRLCFSLCCCRGLPLDISGLPGVESLTAKEAELCANTRLLPAQYLSLKDVMMRDAQVHGHISRTDVSAVCAVMWGSGCERRAQLCGGGFKQQCMAAGKQ